MSDTMRCPDCGHENPPGLAACAHCGFPLDPEAAARVAGGAGVGERAGGTPTPPPAGTAEQVFIPRRRPRPPRPRANSQSATLWLIFGSFAALAVIAFAVKSNVDRASQPIEGSTPVQQASADSVVAAIEGDSTNVAARVRLGDILYDTGHWPEAIVQYRAAIRMDSSQTASLVDLGVCYYNLGDATDAERLFLLALKRDAHQPVALFNLGIVYERRKDYRRAIENFHRALATEPPEEMKQAIVDAMARIQQQQGMTPKPLQE